MLVNMSPGMPLEKQRKLPLVKLESHCYAHQCLFLSAMSTYYRAYTAEYALAHFNAYLKGQQTFSDRVMHILVV